MPNFTERAIQASFLKLLNQKPLSQVSVRMIVEDCGINRNSFYYHYRDIPALIEEIVKKEMEQIIQEYPTVESLDDCVSRIIRYLVENKKAVWHIYDSVNRDIFERNLMKLCDYVIQTYLAAVFAGESIPTNNQETVVRFFKCEIYGLLFEWLMNGMREDVLGEVTRITGVCRGLSDDIIRRINEENNV